MESSNTRKPLLSIHAMTLCSLFTALITVGAFIRIPFPIVPITLQTLFVVLAALLLGPRYSMISVGMYLFLGLAGLPIFTKGGGPGYILQPTFGYLIGFLAACQVIGILAKKLFPASGKTSGGLAILRYWGVGMAGIAVIYAVGMVYLALVMKFYMNTPVGFLSLFTVNFLLTAGGDMFKCLVAALLVSRLLPILRKSSRFQL
jgi:biotin transport system substrate-specific component